MMAEGMFGDRTGAGARWNSNVGLPSGPQVENVAAVRGFRRVGRLTIGLQVANVANLPHTRGENY